MEVTKSSNDAEKLLEKLTLDSPTQINAAATLEILESKPKDDQSAPIIRHCATCLQLCGPPIKKCGGCKKRAYCSKKCQIDDWKVTGTGQRHKNWCGRYEYGEEDIDWEVVPVPNKGLGIRAKRHLPAGYKIIVEPVYTNPHDHPGIKDLEPKRASLEAKFHFNTIVGNSNREEGKSFVGLRISRVNHACRPNSAYVYDDGARVEVLYALQDIESGEEICFSYCNFAQFDRERATVGMDLETETFNIQLPLRAKWRINCPADCICKDPDILKLVVKGRRLSDEIVFWVDRGEAYHVLLAGSELMNIHRKLNMSWFDQVSLNVELFRIAISRRQTLANANRLISAALEVYRNVTPFSKNIKEFESLVDHPERHENYLKIDAVLREAMDQSWQMV